MNNVAEPIVNDSPYFKSEGASLSNNESGTKFWAEMSQGAENKMYTLWRYVANDKFCNQFYLQNLGADHDESWAKAVAYAKRCNIELFDASMDELRKIVRGEDVLRFGKHKDERIKDLPDGYLLWMANGGKITVEGKRQEEMIFLATELHQNLAKLEAVKRGKMVEYDGKIISIWLRDKIEGEKKSIHIGKVGDKIAKELHYQTSRFIYDSGFGAVYLNKFLDESGNIIIYKGKNLEGDYINLYVCKITGEMFEGSSKNYEEIFHFGIDNHRYHTFYEPTAAGKRTEEAHRIEEIVRQYPLDGKLPEKANGVKLMENGELKFYYLDSRDEGMKRQFETGQSYKISGSIKEHSEYNGIKQTIIQRPKITKI